MDNNGPIARFYKAHPDVPMISHASKSGMGTVPSVAFQYCEALRTASNFGWYVYPPQSFSLTFDGRNIFIHENGEWVLVKSNRFEDGFPAYWNAHATEQFKDNEPPFISALAIPGLLQIFTGYFVETRPGWSILVRPPANLPRGAFDYYEGIVETDAFKPAPLFINVRLTETGKEIFIDREWPLFQVQPILRECYSDVQTSAQIVDGLDDAEAPFDWTGLERTLHVINDPNSSHRLGDYAAVTRKRSKAERSKPD